MIGRLLLVLGVAFGATLVVFSNLLNAAGWSPFEIAGVRGIIGLPIMAALLGRRAFVRRTHVKDLVLTSTAFALGGVFYFFALRYATPGVVISILYLGPVWVVVCENHWTFRKAVAMLLGFVGTAVAAGTGPQHAESLGMLFALLGSGSWATFTLANRRLGKTGVEPLVIGFWALAAAVLLFGWTTVVAVPHWSWTSLGLCLGMGVVTGAGYLWLVSYGTHHCKSDAEAGILQYMEIPFVLLFSFAFLGEAATFNVIFGSACIIASGILISLPSITAKVPTPSAASSD
ncbi:DMT family transporter [Candidatus Uhrbacteria bacterium]|nr:DMT family transporter [Candidatus Uhrbacteria bacterium]